MSEIKCVSAILPAKREIREVWGYDEGGNFESGYDTGWNDAIDEANSIAVDMLTALETVLAGGHLNTGEQAIVANAIAKATGRNVVDVVKGS